MTRQHVFAAIGWSMALALFALGCTTEDPTPNVDVGGSSVDAAADTLDAAPDAAPDAALDAAPDAALDAAPDAAQDAAPAIDQGAADQGVSPDAMVQVDAQVDMAPAPICADGEQRPCEGCPESPQRCVDGQWTPCSVLPPDDWFIDPDGDDFYGPTISVIQASCTAWRDSGATESGIYLIDPDGDAGEPALSVYCDMATDGGGWTRVFHHDIADGYWDGPADALERAVDDPLNLRYSILSRLEALRSSDGHLDLRITWPDSGLPGRNIWRQSSNPTVDPIAGYVAVDVDFVDNGWGGLELSAANPATFINGSVGIASWFYAVGSTGAWGAPPGIPAYRPTAAEVALWVRPDDAVAYTVVSDSIRACGPIEGRATRAGDCAPEQAAAHPDAAEICDGLDNDCDGAVDEGFDNSAWYPDRDGDGRGAGAGSSCASLFAEGVVDDGVYRIWPAGPTEPALDVYCDMRRDGGGWTRVFYHDVADGYFRSDADAAVRSAADPLDLRYSILTHLEDFASFDGRYVMRIEWPETAVLGRNIWSQTSNPTSAPIAGYIGISIDHLSQGWGGLEPANRGQTWLNGSVGIANWFYSIGSQVPWNDPPGVPAAATQAERVALWVRPDDQRAGGTAVYTCEAPAGFVALAGDCDDSDPSVAGGAEELCNGVDDNCDGRVDEDCPFGDLTIDVMPQSLHFYARDLDSNRCRFVVEGETQGVASGARVVVTRDGEPYAAVRDDAAAFAINVELDAGLHLYDVAIEWTDAGGGWRPVTTVEGIVCGDVFLIDGQSNAVASDYQNERLGDLERNTFVRSYGSAVRNASVADDQRFGIAVANANSTQGSIGQWGMRLANRIKDAQQIPVLVINGAVGGTRVDQHQRNQADPVDLNTIYGRMLWRAQQADVARSARAIFWHQGESDGAQAYDRHLELWTAMYTGWLADYPNVEDIFVFQVRAGCGNPTWNRNIHRELPDLLPRVTASMSTAGIDGHDGCHFEHRTYAEWGERMARIVLRDLYDAPPDGNIAAPDPQSARWLSDTELEIEYGATGGGLVLQEGAEAWFSLSDGAEIVGARVVDTRVVLTTAAPSAAVSVSFVDVPGDIPWLVNDLGIGGFAYYGFPIAP